jgi:hypothetical protein
MVDRHRPDRCAPRLGERWRQRHDIILLAPTLAGVVDRGLHHDIATAHLDRGYDTNTVRATLADHHIAEAVIAKRRKPGEPKTPGRPLRLGLRWAVERTNSWLSNYAQLRRNTDRRTIHRLAQLALAITLTITAKPIDWHDRWNTEGAPEVPDSRPTTMGGLDQEQWWQDSTGSSTRPSTAMK